MLNSKNVILSSILMCAVIFSLTSGVYEEPVKDFDVDRNQTHVLEIAKTLPMTGILKMKSNGYVYLDVSNDYITKLFPNLILDGHLRPTNSFGKEEGSHITVVKDTENAEGIENEIGNSYTFQVKELRVITSWGPLQTNPYRCTDVVTGYRWLLAVESEELEELRINYGLSPLIDRHDFHITIGFEVPFRRINNFGQVPYSNKHNGQ
jgi:hypothetical protein